MAAKSKKHNKGNADDDQTQGAIETDGTSGGGVGEKAGQALEVAQQKANQIVQPIKKLAFSQLDNQKEHVVNRLFSASVAIRQIDDQLRQQDQAKVAEYGDTAARQLEQFTTYLRDTDASALVQGVSDFAKRNPLIFVGGALALGLLGARFLKSSDGGATANGSHTEQATNGAGA